VNRTATELQVPHNSQSEFCFMLIHVQLLYSSAARE